MARKSLKLKTLKIRQKADRQFNAGKKITFATKLYNRCSVC
jgi:hypothetical protein